MTIHDQGDSIAFTLHLENLRELFAAPQFDPFSSQSRVESGMDEIANHLRTRRLKNPQAVSRYCDLHISQATVIKQARRYEGISKLGTGLLALPLVVVLIALILFFTTNLPEPVLLFLTPLITVIIWVAIWNPFDVLLYNRLGEYRTIRIYSCIKQMTLEIGSDEPFENIRP